jgi:hypothetical protein
MKNDKKNKNIPHSPFTKQTGMSLPWVMIHPFNNERLQQK